MLAKINVKKKNIMTLPIIIHIFYNFLHNWHSNTIIFIQTRTYTQPELQSLSLQHSWNHKAQKNTHELTETCLKWRNGSLSGSVFLSLM